jgi:hypothetical protein
MMKAGMYELHGFSVPTESYNHEKIHETFCQLQIHFSKSTLNVTDLQKLHMDSTIFLMIPENSENPCG